MLLTRHRQSLPRAGQTQKDKKEIAGLKRDLIGKYRGDAKPDATPQKAPNH
jgi:hypothetical protein